MIREQLFGKSFVFRANQYTVWHNYDCERLGTTNTIIRALVMSHAIEFNIIGNAPINMQSHFSMPIVTNKDSYPDHIQYGYTPETTPFGLSPSRPIECQIFDDLNTIRFSMLSPLRYVDFQGEFM